MKSLATFFRTVLPRVFNRNFMAHVLMIAAIVLVGVGAYQFGAGWGWLSAGLATGLYAYLLGRE